MSDAASKATIERLRRAFDDRFAAPAAVRDDRYEDVLLVGADAGGYALSLRGAGALVSTPAVTPLPSPHPALLGLTSIRGLLTAVYDLRVLVEERAPTGPTPRWTLLCSPAGVGVTFDRLEGHHRLGLDAIQAPSSARPTAQIGGELRPLLRPTVLLDTIETRGAASPSLDQNA